MRKLRLDLHALRVQSFGTAAERRTHGTVRGAESGEHDTDAGCETLVCRGARC